MKKIMNVILLALVLTTTAWAHDGGTGITVDALAKTSFSWNEAALPAYDQGIPEVTILKITIAPKTELPLHQHPRYQCRGIVEGAVNRCDGR